MDHNAVYVRMALTGWNTNIKRVDDLFAGLTDQQLMQEIAPGRNRGIYLLGHLTAVHDDMADILGLGEKRHPELEAVFLTRPDDRSNSDMPTLPVLRQYWSEANKRLADHFSGMTPEQWFTPHRRMSADDFAREPHRNKLSVLLSRSGHLAYHHGQLVLLRK